MCSKNQFQRRSPALLLSVLTGILVSYPSISNASSFDAAGASPMLLAQLPTESAYTLGPGDRVRIDVFQVAQYGGEFDVLINGTVNLPVAGEVDVRGLTLDQAEAAISSRYAQFLRRPAVTLSLVTARPLQLTVIGEVNQPGSYTLDGTGSEIPRVTQVLELAGGVRQAADLGQVQIRRLQRSGQEQIIRLDLWQYLQNGNVAYNPYLRDGDTVFIPTATETNLAQSAQLADASFATQDTTPINIAVVGEVFRPGPYTVAGDARTAAAGVPGSTAAGQLPSVTRAIQVAGGITPTANIRRVQVERLARNGEVQTFEVDLWALLNEGDLSQDAILQDRDTVIVPTASEVDPAEASQMAAASFSPNTIRINIVGEVLRPGLVEVPPNTPLNQGLLAAGGFNNRASRSSVQLVRLNPNGSVTREEIDIDFASGLNDASNPALRNNDVIIVGRSDLASIGDTLESVAGPLGGFFNLFTLPLNFLELFQ